MLFRSTGVSLLLLHILSTGACWLTMMWKLSCVWIDLEALHLHSNHHKERFLYHSSLVAGTEGVEVDDKDKEFDGEGSNTVLPPTTF